MRRPLACGQDAKAPEHDRPESVHGTQTSTGAINYKFLKHTPNVKKAFGKGNPRTDRKKWTPRKL